MRSVARSCPGGVARGFQLTNVQDITGLVDLIEVIRIQQSGPTEAARALRKKLYVFPLFKSNAFFLTAR